MAAKLCVLDGQMLGSTTFYYSVLQPSTYNHTITMFYKVLLCETTYDNVLRTTTTLLHATTILQPYFTPYCNRTTPYCDRTSPNYNVLLRTTKCYNVLLHQSLSKSRWGGPNETTISQAEPITTVGETWKLVIIQKVGLFPLI